ncbi:DivIVA domain-containing protein [Nitriliruptor alkaliphilus]|uniref:DivIVA domain-containing protein n=1 Tax=Nitriliruptor alkaliphilus TaxID=427918 RepID=UPI0006986EA1|nr:DivIVA domain-containing protein [Nitriliruptor alkaliphilus]
MDLNPDDIVGYRFKQSLRGYAIDEVDDLLDRLADQVERMAAELAALRGQVQDAEARAAATRETEATLQRTLVVAQQAAERNLADASAQAEATLAQAQAEAERLRREVEEEVSAVRTEAKATASRTLEQAQLLAQREVEAARARVEQAAARHHEVLVGVARHRDALRGHLAALEELVLEPAPAPRADLVVGELPDRAPGHGSDEGDEGGDHAADDAAVDAGPPLTVRVHEDRGDPAGYPPPVGSEVRDGD